MSLRKTMLLSLVCLCTYAGATAQQTQAKPRLFASYPSVLNISETCLQNIFSFTSGQETTIDFGTGLLFPCKVIRNENKYSNLQTVIIRSSAFDHAMLQVSRIVNPDNSISYTGRILNERAADGFEISKSATGSYQLKKFETDKVLEGCFL